jgi:cytochrome bd-type quinol oxidase subunit 2
MEKKSMIYLSIGLLLILIIIIQLVYFYVKRKRINNNTDAGSERRIQTVEQLLRSYLGNGWPIMISIFLVLIVLILILLYFVMNKIGDIDVNISPSCSTTIMIGSVIYMIIYTAFILYLFLKIRSKETDDDKRKFIDILLLAVSFIIGILLIFGGGFYLLKKSRGE